MKKNLNKKQVMNYGISVLFRAIPLLMALFCFGYGFFVFNYGVDSSRFVAGEDMSKIKPARKVMVAERYPRIGKANLATLLYVWII